MLSRELAKAIIGETCIKSYSVSRTPEPKKKRCDFNLSSPRDSVHLILKLMRGSNFQVSRSDKLEPSPNPR